MEAGLLWALVAVVLFAPLPFGSNRPWSWSLLGLLIGSILLFWALATPLGRVSAVFLPLSLTLVVGLFALVVVVVVVQVSCWSPRDWHHPAWRFVADLPQEFGCPAVTINREATWTALSRLLTYGGGFWLAVQLTGRSTYAHVLLKGVAIAIAAYAGYGLVVHFGDLGLILWYRKWAYEGVVTGTFVNRNSFATFAGIGAVCNLAIIIHTTLAAQQARDGNGLQLRWAIETIAGRCYPYVAGFLLCSVAVVLTASRAGTASTCLGLIVLTMTAGIHHRTAWHWRSAGAALMLALVLLAIMAGGSELLRRLERTSEDAEHRGIVIGRTLEAALEQPWLGTGYGTFEDAWTLYRPEEIGRWFRQAHSTYAENLLELGVLGSVPLVLCVGAIVVLCARGLVIRRRNGIFPSAALAAGVVPIAHSTIDFTLQMPAIALLFAVLLGMGVRQSFPEAARAARPSGSERGSRRRRQ